MGANFHNLKNTNFENIHEALGVRFFLGHSVYTGCANKKGSPSKMSISQKLVNIFTPNF